MAPVATDARESAGAPEPSNTKGFAVLLHLEALARGAETIQSLQFLAVNETRRLVPYRQGFLLIAASSRAAHCRLVAATSIAVVDRDAPFARWLERAVMAAREKFGDEAPRALSAEDMPEKLRADWREHSLPFVLWCPLRLPDKSFVGGLWLARDTPWSDNEPMLVQRLADTYAHAWLALGGRRRQARRWGLRKSIAALVALAFVASMFVPIRLSTLAPVEVVAKDPTIVSAPIDGVIADIYLLPNTPVREGDTIFVFEDTNLRSEYEVAEKTLEVAIAEFRKASQGAFSDARSQADVALLKAQVELREAERDYAKDLLDRVLVKAPRTGLLIYTDKSDWVGKPVVLGERIMEVADPGQIELRIDLPVDDAIVLSEGAQVDVFLDVDPLTSVSANLTHASYHAEPTPDQILAYRVRADFEATEPAVRIGLQGTAKIYGEKVKLFFFLFRRVISTARQMVGL